MHILKVLNRLILLLKDKYDTDLGIELPEDTCQ